MWFSSSSHPFQNILYLYLLSWYWRWTLHVNFSGSLTCLHLKKWDQQGLSRARISCTDIFAVAVSGERPFVCDICKKAFNQKNALQMHLKKHSGQKPHRCSYCELAFTQKGNLKTHIKRAHHSDMVQSMNLQTVPSQVSLPPAGIVTDMAATVDCMDSQLDDVINTVTQEDVDQKTSEVSMVDLNRVLAFSEFSPSKSSATDLGSFTSQSQWV